VTPPPNLVRNLNLAETVIPTETQQRAPLVLASFSCGNHGNSSYFCGLEESSMCPLAPQKERVRQKSKLNPLCHAVLEGDTDSGKHRLHPPPTNAPFPAHGWIKHLPKKAIPCLQSSSGSLGFSEAWPQPAHTACRCRKG
jgi:hypothetical protein